MMADSTEAASRSLPEKTEDSIRQLVNMIVDQQMAEGYFSSCPITFQDIATAKEVLVSSLKTIYHARISYPTLEQSSSLTPEVQSEVAIAQPAEGKEKV